MMLNVERRPILFYDETQKPQTPVRTKNALEVRNLFAELPPRGRVSVYFGQAGPYEFWDSGKACTDSMKDWVLPLDSVREVAVERVREKARMRQEAKRRAG
jgi:hypothetical protein